MATLDLSIRIIPGNQNHHLWNNNGTWWCHYTLHEPDFTKRRVRASLQTSDAEQARARRVRLLHGQGQRESERDKKEESDESDT